KAAIGIVFCSCKQVRHAAQRGKKKPAEKDCPCSPAFEVKARSCDHANRNKMQSSRLHQPIQWPASPTSADEIPYVVTTRCSCKGYSQQQHNIEITVNRKRSRRKQNQGCRKGKPNGCNENG